MGNYMLRSKGLLPDTEVPLGQAIRTQQLLDAPRVTPNAPCINDTQSVRSAPVYSTVDATRINLTRPVRPERPEQPNPYEMSNQSNAEDEDGEDNLTDLDDEYMSALSWMTKMEKTTTENPARIQCASSWRH